MFSGGVEEAEEGQGVEVLGWVEGREGVSREKYFLADQVGIGPPQGNHCTRFICLFSYLAIAILRRKLTGKNNIYIVNCLAVQLACYLVPGQLLKLTWLARFPLSSLSPLKVRVH